MGARMDNWPGRPGAGAWAAGGGWRARAHATRLTRCPCAIPQVRVINRGAFGTVLLAVEVATGRQVAVKLTERGSQARRTLGPSLAGLGPRRRRRAAPALQLPCDFKSTRLGL